MLGTKNVKYGGIIKASKNLLNYTYLKESASRRSVATVLVTYVAILIEPNLCL